MLPSQLAQYLPILLFFGFAAILTVGFLAANYFLAPARPDVNKNAPYECGFDAFADARGKYDVRFYLVSILFIIFDLEIAFLFPWAITLGHTGMFGFWSMVIFLAILTVGFLYEWRKGALDWE